MEHNGTPEQYGYGDLPLMVLAGVAPGVQAETVIAECSRFGVVEACTVHGTVANITMKSHTEALEGGMFSEKCRNEVLQGKVQLKHQLHKVNCENLLIEYPDSSIGLQDLDDYFSLFGTLYSITILCASGDVLLRYDTAEDTRTAANFPIAHEVNGVPLAMRILTGNVVIMPDQVISNLRARQLEETTRTNDPQREEQIKNIRIPPRLPQSQSSSLPQSSALPHSSSLPPSGSLPQSTLRTTDTLATKDAAVIKGATLPASALLPPTAHAPRPVVSGTPIIRPMRPHGRHSAVGVQSILPSSRFSPY